MRKVLWTMSAALMFMALTQAVYAKDLQISCDAPTICTSVNGILTTSSSTLNLTLSDANNKYTGALYLAIIVPDGGAGVGGTLSENSGTTDPGTLFQEANNVEMWLDLGEASAGKGNDHNYGSTESKSPSLNGYTLYDIELASNFTGPVNFTAFAPMPGTLFVGFTENSKDKVLLATPWSESLDSGGTPPPPAPEPASFSLLGSGLVGMGMVLRRLRQ